MKKLILLALTITLMYGCKLSNHQNSIKKSNSENHQAHNEKESDETSANLAKKEESELVNKYWKLKILEGQAVKMSKNQEKEQYFILKNDGTIIGFAGCNQFNGQYEIQQGMRIRFNENMAVTMKACLDSDTRENEFLQVFKLTNNYTVKDDTLSLNVGRRAPLAVFEAVYL